MYRRLFAEHQGLDKPEVDFVELPEVNKEVTDYDRVVNLVFVPDHRTALPSSDISVYLSAKTPPQVREFIKDNIFRGEKTAQSLGDGGDTRKTSSNASNNV